LKSGKGRAAAAPARVPCGRGSAPATVSEVCTVLPTAVQAGARRLRRFTGGENALSREWQRKGCAGRDQPRKRSEQRAFGPDPPSGQVAGRTGAEAVKVEVEVAGERMAGGTGIATSRQRKA